MSEHFTTPDDRRALWRCFIVVLSVISFWLFLASRAHADISERQDNHYIEQQTHRISHKPSRIGAVKRFAPSRSAGVIGGRPSGCPHAFCGCALSIKIFGAIKPQLNLAANWMRAFPRTSPAPGMVAARRGHVFQLVSHSGGNVWTVYDPNSGGGRIRIHERSIAGLVIVNPYANRVAMVHQ